MLLSFRTTMPGVTNEYEISESLIYHVSLFLTSLGFWASWLSNKVLELWFLAVLV